MKYKIGDVRNILGISAETLRFFESKGLISPERDYLNNYRAFSSLDLNKIIAYKFYRSMEFSLEDSMEMINKMSNKKTGSRIDDKLTGIRQKADFYNNLVVRMTELADLYKGADTVLDSHSVIDDFRGLYFYYNQTNSEFNTNSLYFKQTKKWLNELPFVDIALQIPISGINTGDVINYGYSIQTDYSAISDRLKADSVFFLPPGRRVHVIYKVSEDEKLNAVTLSPLFKYIQDNQYQMNNDIFGRIINEDEESGRKVRYFELFASIK